MVFVATPDMSWSDSIAIAIGAYETKRISADSAARLIAPHMRGRSVNLDLDDRLRDALERELRKRGR